MFYFSNSTYTEQEIISMIRKGKKELFRLFVENYWDKVHNIIRRFHKDKDIIIDLCQETFIKAYTSLDTYDSTKPFGPWISKIALNIALMHKRKEIKKIEEFTLDDTRFLNCSSALSNQIENKIEQLSLDSIIAKLPPQLQIILVMKYTLDLSCKEISQLLNEPEGSIKAYLFKARELIRINLEISNSITFTVNPEEN